MVADYCVPNKCTWSRIWFAKYTLHCRPRCKQDNGKRAEIIDWCDKNSHQVTTLDSLHFISDAIICPGPFLSKFKLEINLHLIVVQTLARYDQSKLMGMPLSCVEQQ